MRRVLSWGLVVSRPTPVPNVYGVVLEGGTSTTGRLRWSVAPSTPAASVVGRERMSAGRVGRLGTLLGPEGTARVAGCCFGVAWSW